MHIRRDAKSKSVSSKQKAARIQEQIVHSDTIEHREIRHPAAIDKEAFLEQFPIQKSTYAVRRHISLRHRLSKKWSKLMGRKVWRTMSEITLRQSAAAWQWLITLSNSYGEGLANPLLSVSNSKVLVDMLLVKRCDDDDEDVYMSLGCYHWAALAVRCRSMSFSGDLASFAFGSTILENELQWIQVTDPRAWVSIPWNAERSGGNCDMLFFRQSAPAEPLLKACLGSKRHDLLHGDLLRLARLLELPGVGVFSTVVDLRRALALAVSDNDEAFADFVADEKSQATVVDLLVQDPLFEAAFSDLQQDEQDEHPEIAKALKWAKKRRRVGQAQLENLKERVSKKRKQPLGFKNARKRRRRNPMVAEEDPYTLPTVLLLSLCVCRLIIHHHHPGITTHTF